MINGIKLSIPYSENFQYPAHPNLFYIQIDGKMRPSVPAAWIEKVARNSFSVSEFVRDIHVSTFGLDEFSLLITFDAETTLSAIRGHIDAFLRAFAEFTEEKSIELEFIKENLR